MTLRTVRIVRIDAGPVVVERELQGCGQRLRGDHGNLDDAPQHLLGIAEVRAFHAVIVHDREVDPVGGQKVHRDPACENLPVAVRGVELQFHGPFPVRSDGDVEILVDLVPRQSVVEYAGGIGQSAADGDLGLPGYEAPGQVEGVVCIVAGCEAQPGGEGLPGLYLACGGREGHVTGGYPCILRIRPAEGDVQHVGPVAPQIEVRGAVIARIDMVVDRLPFIERRYPESRRILRGIQVCPLFRRGDMGNFARQVLRQVVNRAEGGRAALLRWPVAELADGIPGKADDARRDA